MPPIYTDLHIRTGIHDFKTNINKYIRELNTGEYSSLILTSRGNPVGGFYTFEGVKKREERAKLKELSGLLNGPDKGLTGLLSGLSRLSDDD